MPPHRVRQNPQREGRVSLATHALQSKQLQSQREASRVYTVPRRTVQRRLQGIRPKHETTPVNARLTPVEQQSLVQWILDLDRRGFPPQIIDVRRMADALLTARGQNPPPPPVGKNWVARFIAGQAELQTKWNRKFHSQRALCEDPVQIQAWFKLVQDTRVAYGIPDQDVYNFDETGF